MHVDCDSLDSRNVVGFGSDAEKGGMDEFCGKHPQLTGIGTPGLPIGHLPRYFCYPCQ